MKIFLWFSREFQGLHRWIADPIGHRRTRNGSSRPGLHWQITSLNSMHQYHELYFFFLKAHPKQCIFVILLHRYLGAVNSCKTIKFVFPCYFPFYFSTSKSISMCSSILGKTVAVLVRTCKSVQGIMTSISHDFLPRFCLPFPFAVWLPTSFTSQSLIIH